MSIMSAIQSVSPSVRQSIHQAELDLSQTSRYSNNFPIQIFSGLLDPPVRPEAADGGALHLHLRPQVRGTPSEILPGLEACPERS